MGCGSSAAAQAGGASYKKGAAVLPVSRKELAAEHIKIITADQWDMNVLGDPGIPTQLGASSDEYIQDTTSLALQIDYYSVMEREAEGPASNRTDQEQLRVDDICMAVDHKLPVMWRDGKPGSLLAARIRRIVTKCGITPAGMSEKGSVLPKHVAAVLTQLRLSADGGDAGYCRAAIFVATAEGLPPSEGKNFDLPADAALLLDVCYTAHESKKKGAGQKKPGMTAEQALALKHNKGRG